MVSPITSAFCKTAMRNGLIARSRRCLALQNKIRLARPENQVPFGFHYLDAPLRWNRTGRRGVKSKATISLSELLNDRDEPGHGLPYEHITGKVYPTVVQQALDNMEKYGNCVLLTRVGSFYEVKVLGISRLPMLTQFHSSISIKQTNTARCSISKLQKRRPLKDQYQWQASRSISSIAFSRS